MKLKRKNYLEIAAIFKALQVRFPGSIEIEIAINYFINYFKSNNPDFDQVKFLKELQN